MEILSSERKKVLRRFFRRHGHQLVGIAVLAGVIAIGYIGYRETHPKPIPMDDEPWTMEELLGIDGLDLSCDVRVDGFDGESFIYSIYFDRNVTEEDIAEAETRLEPLWSQNSEEEYYGYISEVSKDADNMLSVMLDLGNADSDRFIGDILCALDDMEGISEIVINEGMDEFY